MDDILKDLQIKLLYRVGSEIVNIAKDNAPYATGNLKKDIQVFDDRIDKLEVEIGNSLMATYAPYVHEGTGIYGKKKRRITPKKAKALKTPYGYRKSIAGQKAQPYLQNAREEYVETGGLDRAIDATSKSMVKAVAKSIEVSLKQGLKK